MTSKSAAELEREAEAARASLIQTAEAIQNRMSPGRMVDEFSDYFRHSDGAKAFENMKTQVRDNPLPLALVGAGLAWLFMGGGPKSRDMAEAVGAPSRPDGPANDAWRRTPGVAQPSPGAGLSGTHQTGMKDSAGGAMKSAASKAGSAYETASGRVSSAAGSAADTASHTGEKTAEAVRHAGSRTQRMFSDTLDQEPLIIGALGVAVGAAIAAVLPRTRVEEEYVGPYAEKAGESAKEAMSRGAESARNVAGEAYRAGARQAEKQTHGQAGSAGPSAGASNSTNSRPAPAEPVGSSTGAPAQASPGKEPEKKS